MTNAASKGGARLARLLDRRHLRSCHGRRIVPFPTPPRGVERIGSDRTRSGTGGSSLFPRSAGLGRASRTGRRSVVQGRAPPRPHDPNRSWIRPDGSSRSSMPPGGPYTTSDRRPLHPGKSARKNGGSGLIFAQRGSQTRSHEQNRLGSAPKRQVSEPDGLIFDPGAGLGAWVSNHA